MRLTNHRENPSGGFPDAIGLAPDEFERGLPELLPRVVCPSDFDEFFETPTVGAPTQAHICMIYMTTCEHPHSPRTQTWRGKAGVYLGELRASLPGCGTWRIR